jgi:hypothetical protein
VPSSLDTAPPFLFPPFRPPKLWNELGVVVDEATQLQPVKTLADEIANGPPQEDGSWPPAAVELATGMYTNYYSADTIRLLASIRLKDQAMAKLTNKQAIEALIAGHIKPGTWTTYLMLAKMHIREVFSRLLCLLSNEASLIELVPRGLLFCPSGYK